MPVTTLGRPLDPRSSSNRVILVLGALATATGFLRWSDGDLISSLIAAGLVGILIVMTWALARELDPDRPTSATIAAILVWVAALLVEGIPILPLVGLMIAGRVLLRSTGLPPTALDLMALIAGAFILGRTGAGWIAALMLAFAVARDRTLPGESVSRLARIVAPFGITIVASLSVAIFSLERWAAPTWWAIAIGVAGLIAGVSMPTYSPISPCDLRGMPLEPKRLQSARRVVLFGAVLISALGDIGLPAMLPVWVSFIAIWASHRGPIPEFHPVDQKPELST